MVQHDQLRLEPVAPRAEVRAGPLEDFHAPSPATPMPTTAAATARPSPLPNRAAPDGSLHAVPERGLLMGNRGGRLHRADGTLGAARWRSRAWICLPDSTSAAATAR